MEPAEKAFHEVLLSLGQGNLDNLIIVGGWCPYRKPEERAMQMLEPTYKSWGIPKPKIREEIETTFEPLLSFI